MSIIRETLSDRVFNAVNVFVLTLIMLVVLYPLWYVVICSVSEPMLVNTGQVWLWPRGFSLDAYARVFQDGEIMIGYRNTVFYTVAGTFLNLALTLTSAYALSKKEFMGRNIVMFLIAFTMYFSGGMIPNYLLMKRLGLINTWFVLVVIGAVSAYNLIISRTFFANGVPREIEEAAMIDGCSTTQTFFRIVLPLSKALVGVMALYYGMAHWNTFFNALIYVTDRGKIPLQLVLREILVINVRNASMLEGLDDETASYYLHLANLLKYALIIVSSLPLLAVYPFLQKYFDRGVMLGSIKG